MATINLTRSQSAKIGPLIEGLGHGHGVIYSAMAVAMLVSIALLFAIPEESPAAAPA